MKFYCHDPGGYLYPYNSHLFWEKFVTTFWNKLIIFSWRYEVCPLNHFYAKKLTTSANLIFFWICYLAVSPSNLGHYREGSFTPLALITASYLFLIRKSLEALYQGLVPKPDQSASAI